MAKPLTDDERAEILHLASVEGLSQRRIAAKTGRNRSTIQEVLKALAPTTALAKAHYAAQALDLARRATDTANVEQILEIHDRLGVLERKRDTGPAAAFQINIGMPGAPACPIPTQAQIAEAKALTLPSAPPIDADPDTGDGAA
jgi:ParB-like chromosome segregation protein Spo0J